MNDEYDPTVNLAAKSVPDLREDVAYLEQKLLAEDAIEGITAVGKQLLLLRDVLLVKGWLE